MTGAVQRLTGLHAADSLSTIRESRRRAVYPQAEDVDVETSKVKDVAMEVVVVGVVLTSTATLEELAEVAIQVHFAVISVAVLITRHNASTKKWFRHS